MRNNLLGLAALAAIAASSPAAATTVVADFAGVTNHAMQGIATDTPFTARLVYDDAAVGVTQYVAANAPVGFFGQGFSEFSITIGGRTVTSGPGGLLLGDNEPSTQGYPPGDFLYTFNGARGSPGPSSGSFTGLTPNFIYLGLLDLRGGAVASRSVLPGSLNGFLTGNSFVGFNYGPMGGGNTTSIAFISSITVGTPIPPGPGGGGGGGGEDEDPPGGLTAVPEPGAWAMMLTGFGLVGAMLRRPRTVRGNA